MALVKWYDDEEQKKEDLFAPKQIASVQSTWQPTMQNSGTSAKPQSYLMSDEKAQSDQHIAQRRAAEAQAAAQAQAARQFAQAQQQQQQQQQAQQASVSKNVTPVKKDEKGLMQGLWEGATSSVNRLGNMFAEGIGEITGKNQQIRDNQARAQQESLDMVRLAGQKMRDASLDGAARARWSGLYDKYARDNSASEAIQKYADEQRDKVDLTKNLAALGAVGLDVLSAGTASRMLTPLKGAGALNRATSTTLRGAQQLSPLIKTPQLLQNINNPVLRGLVQGSAVGAGYGAAYAPLITLEEMGSDAKIDDFLQTAAVSVGSGALLGGGIGGLPPLVVRGVNKFRVNRGLPELSSGEIRTLEQNPDSVLDADGTVKISDNTPKEVTPAAQQTTAPQPQRSLTLDELSDRATQPLQNELTPEPQQMTPEPQAPKTPEQTAIDEVRLREQAQREQPVEQTPVRDESVQPTPEVADGVVNPQPVLPDMPEVRSEQVTALQEARAGKSQAEEAVINQQLQEVQGSTPRKVYRGGDATGFDPTKVTDKGVSVATDRENAQWFGGGYDPDYAAKSGKRVQELELAADAKILDVNDVPPQLQEAFKRLNTDNTTLKEEAALMAYARENGYDAVDVAPWGEAEIRVLNPDIIRDPKAPAPRGEQTPRKTGRTADDELADIDARLERGEIDLITEADMPDIIATHRARFNDENVTFGSDVIKDEDTMGSYNYHEDMVKLAEGKADLDTLNHEHVHKAIGQFLEDSEIEQLYRDVVKVRGGKRGLQKKYAHYDNPSWRTAAEEEIANEFNSFLKYGQTIKSSDNIADKLADFATKHKLPWKVIETFMKLSNKINETFGRNNAATRLDDFYKRIVNEEFANPNLPRRTSKYQKPEGLGTRVTKGIRDGVGGTLIGASRVTPVGRTPLFDSGLRVKYGKSAVDAADAEDGVAYSKKSPSDYEGEVPAYNRLSRADKEAVDNIIYEQNPELLYRQDLSGERPLGEGGSGTIPRMHTDDLKKYFGNLAEDIPSRYKRSTGKRDIDELATLSGFDNIDDFVESIQQTLGTRKDSRASSRRLSELHRDPEIRKTLEQAKKEDASFVSQKPYEPTKKDMDEYDKLRRAELSKDVTPVKKAEKKGTSELPAKPKRIPKAQPSTASVRLAKEQGNLDSRRAKNVRPTKPEPKSTEKFTPVKKSNLPDGMGDVTPVKAPKAPKAKKTITPEQQGEKDFANRFISMPAKENSLKGDLARAVGMGEDASSPVRDILRDGGVESNKAEKLATLFDRVDEIIESKRQTQKGFRKSSIKGEDVDIDAAKGRNRLTREEANIVSQLVSEINSLNLKGKKGERAIQALDNYVKGKNLNQLTGAPIERGWTADILGTAMYTAKNPILMGRSMTQHGNPASSALGTVKRGWTTLPKSVSEAYKYGIGNTYKTLMTPAQIAADMRKGAFRTETTKWAKKELTGKNLTNSEAEKISRTAGDDLEALVNMGAGVDNGSVNLFRYRKAKKQWKEFIKSGSEADHRKFLDTVDRQNSIAEAIQKGIIDPKYKVIAPLVNGLFPYMRNAVNMTVKGVAQDLNPFTLSLIDGIRKDQRGWAKNLMLGIKNKTVDYAVLAALGSVLTYNPSSDVDDQGVPPGVSIHLGGDNYFSIRGTSLELPLAVIQMTKEIAQDTASGEGKEWTYYADMVRGSLPYIDYMDSHGNVIDSLANIGGKDGDNLYAAKNFGVSNTKSLIPFSNNNLQASASRFTGSRSLDAKKTYDADIGTWIGNHLKNNFGFLPGVDRDSLEDSRDASGRVRTVNNQGSWMNKTINDKNTATYNQTISDLVKYARQNKLGNGTQEMFNTYDTGKNNNFKSVQDSITFFGVGDGEKPKNEDKLKSNPKIAELATQIRDGFFGDTGSELLTLDGKNLYSDVSVPGKYGGKNTRLPLSMEAIKNAIAQTDLPEDQRTALYEIGQQKQGLYERRKAGEITYDQEKAMRSQIAQQEQELMQNSASYQRLQSLMDELTGQGFFEAGGLGSTKSGQTYLWNSLNAMLGSKGTTPAANYPEAVKSGGGGGRKGFNNIMTPAEMGTKGIRWSPVGKRQMASVKTKGYTPFKATVKLNNAVKRDRTQNYADRSI